MMQASLQQALLRHNAQIPRYTSYPPANFFTPEAPAPDFYEKAVRSLPADQGVSLYLHIPFCPQMCWFCGCHTRATTRYAPVQDYLASLKVEITRVGALVEQGLPVRHIHFGGGSPTILAPDDFEDLINTLRNNFYIPEATVIAIEIDPRQMDAAHAAAYARAGVTRLSMGVQDIDPIVMKAINRVQPFEQVSGCVTLCRDQGLDDINIDLVYGLPHQTIGGIRKTIRAVLGLNPNRLALFGYAHVPWMKKHMRLIPGESLPDASLRLDLFETATTALESGGYVPIGIDHFARPDDDLAHSARAGTLARNFQGYVPATEDLPIIGLGASAISSLPAGYIQNMPGLPQYRDALVAGTWPHARHHVLTRDDRIRARVIEHLMCDLSVDLTRIQSEFHLPEGYFLHDIARLAPLIADGLAHVTDDHVTVPTRLAVRPVCAAFDAYRDTISHSEPRHAAAV